MTTDVSGEQTEWLDMAAVAARLGIDVGSVRKAKWRGRLPAPDVIAGGHPAWRRETIEAWLPHRDLRRTRHAPAAGPE